MKSNEALFRPFQLKSLNLSNRIVMAPMTRSRCPDQIPTPEVAAYYRRRIEGGVGLILTEGTSPEHESASNDENVPAFFGKDALQGWASVLKEVKAAGGSIIPQLWHMGPIRRPETGPYPDAKSVSPSGFVRPHRKISADAQPMTLAEITQVIEGYAKSAKYAQQLGFDGIEVHAASGYLVDSFFWEGTNLRTDTYGGNLANRTRFAAEIVSSIRQAVGSSFPIALRFSQWKQQDYTARLAQNPKELAEFLEVLTLAGVDLFDCSTRRFWEPEFPETGSDLNLAGWTKKLSGCPTITVGSIGLNRDFITTHTHLGAETTDINRLLEMLERDDFDLVAVGRALLSNPDWANKVKAGRYDELKPYTPEALRVLT